MCGDFEMVLESGNRLPFFDDNDFVFVHDLSSQFSINVDRRDVFETALFGQDGRYIGVKHLQEFRTATSFDLDGSNNTDHVCFQ